MWMSLTQYLLQSSKLLKVKPLGVILSAIFRELSDH
jgi:hypothetical protein